MRFTAILILFAVLTTTLSGCWDLRPVEDLAILMALGIDIAPNGEDLTITSSRPVYQQPQSEDEKNAWATARDITHAIRLLQAQEFATLVFGKVIVYVLGEGLWRSGKIGEVARSLYSRPDISLTGLVVCVEGKASDILMQRPPALKRVGVALWQALTAAESMGITPRVSLLEVARADRLQKDLWLPLVSPAKELNAFLLAGSVVFKGDQPATTLSLLDTATLGTLSANAARFALEVTDPSNGKSISYTVSQAKFSVTSKDSPLGHHEINALTRCSVSIGASIDLRGDTSKTIRHLEETIAQDLSARGQRLFNKLQQVDSDPLGLALPGLFTSEDKAWRDRETYGSARITFRAQVKVLGLNAD